MNYSEMSDDQINLTIFEQTYGPLGEDRDMLRVWQQGKFQPCNSWGDAGPIIERHGVGLIKIDEVSGPLDAIDLVGMWDCCGPVDWAYGECDSDISVRHKNPLRAAMIVFLMMQESKNA